MSRRGVKCFSVFVHRGERNSDRVNPFQLPGRYCNLCSAPYCEDSSAAMNESPQAEDPPDAVEDIFERPASYRRRVGFSPPIPPTCRCYQELPQFPVPRYARLPLHLQHLAIRAGIEHLESLQQQRRPHRRQSPILRDLPQDPQHRRPGRCVGAQ